MALREAVRFMEAEMEEEHGVPIRIPVDVVGAEYFYLPPSGDILVNPEATMGVAKVFHVLGMADRWTISSRYFDAANYGLFSGNDADMKAKNKQCVDEAGRLGAKVLFMGECGHAYRVMKMLMEKGKWWGDLPFRIVNCMEWTAEKIRQGALRFDPSKNPQRVTYHDPCNFGRSCNIVEEPRAILRATCQDFREMVPNRTDNWCCGGGGGLAAMDGAKYVATACSNCKKQLMQLMEYHRTGIAVGGVHDLLSRSILIDGKAANRAEY